MKTAAIAAQVSPSAANCIHSGRGRRRGDELREESREEHERLGGQGDRHGGDQRAEPRGQHEGHHDVAGAEPEDRSGHRAAAPRSAWSTPGAYAAGMLLITPSVSRPCPSPLPIIQFQILDPGV
ncbi:hypothetical protein Kosp01_20370 [Kocuria sp. NBRC 114282]|nr:hypothetical protein Kosp01_20370 [Kocuria sp. NBRC 114282]